MLLTTLFEFRTRDNINRRQLDVFIRQTTTQIAVVSYDGTNAVILLGDMFGIDYSEPPVDSVFVREREWLTRALARYFQERLLAHIELLSKQRGPRFAMPYALREHLNEFDDKIRLADWATRDSLDEGNMAASDFTKDDPPFLQKMLNGVPFSDSDRLFAIYGKDFSDAAPPSPQYSTDSPVRNLDLAGGFSPASPDGTNERAQRLEEEEKQQRNSENSDAAIEQLFADVRAQSVETLATVVDDESDDVGESPSKFHRRMAAAPGPSSSSVRTPSAAATRVKEVPAAPITRKTRPAAAWKPCTSRSAGRRKQFKEVRNLMKSLDNAYNHNDKK